MENHPVTRWRERQAPRVSIRDLARRSGLSDVHIGEIERGTSGCGRKAAKALSAATGGELTVGELVSYPTEEERAS